MSIAADPSTARAGQADGAADARWRSERVPRHRLLQHQQADGGDLGGGERQPGDLDVVTRSGPTDTPEADVRGGVAHAVALAGRGPVALAVVRRAQVGPALGDDPVALLQRQSLGPRRTAAAR